MARRWNFTTVLLAAAVSFLVAAFLRQEPVLVIDTKATIDAPIEVAWGVMLDFPKYPEWNPFVRLQVLADINGVPLENQNQLPIPGQHSFMMTTHIPANMNPPRTGMLYIDWNESRDIVIAVDASKHYLEWDKIDDNPRIQAAKRIQTLKTISLENGKVGTEYHSHIEISGLAARLLGWFAKPKLQKCFDAMGEGLKKRSEEIHANQR